MGLISDYLEECRERTYAGDLDPCMILSDSIRSNFSSYHKIASVLEEYAKTLEKEKKILLRQQLLTRSQELETIKTGYIIGEKVVLAFWNSEEIKSPLMIDTVQLLLSELRKSYQAICELRQQINEQLGERITISFESPSEESIRKKMLHILSSSILNYLRKDSSQMDTSEFRKVVFDFATLIRTFEQEQYNQPAKKIVAYYLEKNFNMRNSNYICSGCGNFLLNDIPYCLNCYERN